MCASRRENGFLFLRDNFRRRSQMTLRTDKNLEADAITSSQDKETSLEQQFRAAELKGKSDALADVNRTLAESTKARKAAEAAEQRVTQMVREYEETIKDEPDKLNEFRGRQAKTKADA